MVLRSSILLSKRQIINYKIHLRFAFSPIVRKPCIRCFSSAISNIRNIGISAHIDSGKTTLTERILYYTGRIKRMHEVRGKDGVGAKMDSMELEREKGITIKSAATFAEWNGFELNIIDTPGHVDFTIEVERSMRVLDGAILVLCGASGVQSQSITVDRQMKRYKVPRVAFINKLDRLGADAFSVLEAVRKKLGANAALLQIPIGREEYFKGLVDVIRMESVYFKGDDGREIVRGSVPPGQLQTAKNTRDRLIEALSEVDERMEELFLEETEPSIEEIQAAIRRSTIARKFVPMFIGSAFKNKGVQTLLEGVGAYLPSPEDVENAGFIKSNVSEEKDGGEGEGKTVLLPPNPEKPLLCLAFKLEESKFGQLTWIRVYQGCLRKGDFIYSVNEGKRAKKIKVNRIVKMHSEEVKEINKVEAGEIAALFGVTCDSGTTFGAIGQNILLSNMVVPEPVISYAVKVKNSDKLENFSKALKRFQREDPTFKRYDDKKTGEILISGMGELHLDIYIERLKREYKVQIETSAPRVNYEERITQNAEFDYLHKKQTGGAGQYARIIGHVEPIGKNEKGYPLEFVNKLRGNNIPYNFVPGIKKSFIRFMDKGPLVGGKVLGVRMVLKDGVTHDVDSTEFAFMKATVGAIKQALKKAGAVIYEPLMSLEVTSPQKFQNQVVSSLSRRAAQLSDIQRLEDTISIKSTVPLENMFGYSSEIRGLTEGKGEFSMEYLKHSQVPYDKQKRLCSIS